MKTKRKKHSEMDVIKAVRKASRELEIELHGHPINHVSTHKSKKTYTRKEKHKGVKDEHIRREITEGSGGCDEK